MITTEIVLALVVAFLIIYDIFIVIIKGIESTISWTVWSISQKYPVIPFALGFVMGHVLWVQHGA